MRARSVRVLLSEGSSLTAREHVTVLGSAGVRVEVMSSDPFALCRWSRWVRRFYRCPPASVDPVGYLAAVRAVLAGGGFDAVLATHEQAWLFAVGRDRLPVGAPVALAPAESLARVQSKVAFAQLLDELGAPQPRWWFVADHAEVGTTLAAVPTRTSSKPSTAPRGGACAPCGPAGPHSPALAAHTAAVQAEQWRGHVLALSRPRRS